MISVILTMAVIGFIVYLVITYIPMPELFKRVIIVLTVIIMVLYLLRLFGFHDVPVGR